MDQLATVFRKRLLPGQAAAVEAGAANLKNVYAAKKADDQAGAELSLARAAFEQQKKTDEQSLKDQREANAENSAIGKASLGVAVGTSPLGVAAGKWLLGKAGIGAAKAATGMTAASVAPATTAAYSTAPAVAEGVAAGSTVAATGAAPATLIGSGMLGVLGTAGAIGLGVYALGKGIDAIMGDDPTEPWSEKHAESMGKGLAAWNDKMDRLGIGERPKDLSVPLTGENWQQYATGEHSQELRGYTLATMKRVNDYVASADPGSSYGRDRATPTAPAGAGAAKAGKGQAGTGSIYDSALAGL